MIRAKTIRLVAAVSAILLACLLLGGCGDSSPQPSLEAGEEDAALELLSEALAGRIEELSGLAAEGVNIALVADGPAEIDGKQCHTFSLGSSTPEKFTAEEHYAVAQDGTIYWMDVLNGGEYVPYQPELG